MANTRRIASRPLRTTPRKQARDPVLEFLGYLLSLTVCALPAILARFDSLSQTQSPGDPQAPR